MKIVEPNQLEFSEKIRRLLTKIWNHLPPQIKNAENISSLKQIMKRWVGIPCKCYLYQNFSLNGNTIKEIYRQCAIPEQNAIFKSFIISLCFFMCFPNSFQEILTVILVLKLAYIITSSFFVENSQVLSNSNFSVTLKQFDF